MAEMTLPAVRQLRDIPGLRQLALLLGIAAAVAGGISIYMWSQKPAAAPLYANLSAKDSAEVADALRGAGIPYQVDATTGAVTVAGDKLYEARLKLASQGLPKSSGMGFEMIQQEQGFGTSQFIETARYQHALETELARTIGSLQSVQAARVHLAMPKPSAFARDNNAASASVLVDLYPGRSLEGGQVASIVHLVAASVPDLAPGNVTVIDQYGHLLSESGTQNDPAQRAASQFEQARRVEADYVRRIEELLTPMTGTGRISAQVVADMDFSETEEASETYKPDPQAIRSEQTSEDTTHAPGGNAAQGVPGAASNQPATAAQAKPLNPPAAVAAAGAAAAPNGATPPATASDAAGATPTSQSRQSTRNYELDKTVSHTRRPGGSIRRLSVAVLVDNLPKANAKGESELAPLSKDEIAKVEALVKQAVGFDAQRGDTVSVQNVSFINEPAAAVADLPVWQRPQVLSIGRQALGVLLVLIVVFAVLRPAFKSLTAPVPVRATVADSRPGAAALGIERSARALPDANEEPTPRVLPPYEQKLAQARGAVAQDPKRVAQVIKTWVGTDA
ncbi:MAG: flagellar basal body M-ring protein FliF [Nevskiaceae bacterium]|nr:MAG: flagellar basal body M-ring protein FliF [Nevskiaceae bacterium]